MLTMGSLARRVLVMSVISLSSESYVSGVPSPSLSLLEGTLSTTANLDFGGHQPAYEATARWESDRLQTCRIDQRAPHLVCAEYGHGRRASFALRAFLSADTVQHASHSAEHGACFFVTASHTQVAALSADASRFGLVSVGIFPSAAKVAPGLLEHDHTSGFDATHGSGRLTTRHGSSMRLDTVDGLSVELSPGVLVGESLDPNAFIANMEEDLMSESLDLHKMNVWSDPGTDEDGHLTTSEGVLRAREWSAAAAIIHNLSVVAGMTVGDICSWHGLKFHLAGNDLLLVSGGLFFHHN